MIVESERERRFFGTGKLREELLTGKLQSRECKETPEESLHGKINVLPLSDTPSPCEDEPQSKVAKIIKSSTRRSLNVIMNEAGCSRVPDKVLDVVTNKATPVLRQTEKTQQ